MDETSATDTRCVDLNPDDDTAPCRRDVGCLLTHHSKNAAHQLGFTLVRARVESQVIFMAQIVQLERVGHSFGWRHSVERIKIENRIPDIQNELVNE